MVCGGRGIFPINRLGLHSAGPHKTITPRVLGRQRGEWLRVISKTKRENCKRVLNQSVL